MEQPSPDRFDGLFDAVRISHCGVGVIFVHKVTVTGSKSDVGFNDVRRTHRGPIHDFLFARSPASMLGWSCVIRAP
jgi:hypothetical protein